MPYRVILINDGVSTLIHSPINKSKRLLSGVIHHAAAEISSFDFSFNQSNPADAFIKEQITEVEVSDVETGEIEFEGRVRNRTGRTQSSGETVMRYSADDALIYLNDSSQYEFEYDGKPSELFKKLIDHHNEHVEPHKQFAVGRCEIDQYKVYVDDDNETVNQTLTVGSKATIKQTTQHIWHDDGRQLRIASSVLGVTHTVAAVGSSGWQAGKYRLRHPIDAWGISGWIRAEDIVEVGAVSTQTSQTTTTAATTAASTATQTTTSSVYTPGTKVKVKQSATTYYWSADGTRPTTIPQFIKDSVLTTREYSSRYERYAIYRAGTLIAWIDTSNLEGGASQPPTGIIETEGKWVTRSRTIQAEIGYDELTLDAIKKHLLRPFGAEIYWEKIEGVRTIHIVNRRLNETTNRIAIGLNLVAMQENFDPSDIITRLVPLGKPKKEEATTGG